MKKIAIVVLYYMPESEYLSNEYCIPIQVGFHETKEDFGILKDNTGDHRAKKHPIYSEYSGIYWLWKNVNAEYKGMLHHRRAFTTEKMTLKHHAYKLYTYCKVFIKNIFFKHTIFSYADRIECEKSNEYKNKRSTFFQELPNFIEKYDIIVPKPYHFCWTNLEEFFDEVVNRLLMNKTKNIIKIHFPEYSYDFKETLEGGKLFYSNMSIMKKNKFDDYCTFIFGVFDQLEKELLEEGYYINLEEEKCLNRIFGYIGELLTSTFVSKNIRDGVKVMQCTMLFNKESKGFQQSK